MSKDVIIALDFSTKEAAMDFLNAFTGEKPFVKVGMELYYSAGPELVRELKARGYRVFLDLKLHDIPNTVKKTMAVLAGLGADMCNLHAAGGLAMMEAALEGFRSGGGSGKLIAVTQLTSTSQAVMENELLIGGRLEDVVLSYAENAKRAGLDGVVCSPLEAFAVKNRCGEDFLTVTPGVRFADGTVGDQVRVTTPERAGQLGSDYIVMGRPITGAENPVAAYERARKEFLGVN
ncbi:MAG: orotidine-5'-phosphate decarboxylase [Oscillospiraceae bacterium]|jgi:orotidine-5'-phosphate decarboxylase|nr:orotidine-5'-phosphate decarboxylase [Oscillospiraceae bacterium]